MKLWGIAGLLVLASAPALAQNDAISRMLRGESAMQGKELERAIAAAEQHPLGSQANPVRVEMPPGQHAYLARLRCSDGKAPQFQRRGNVGAGVYGNIVDLYDLRCEGGEPAASEVFMDMYHRGHSEDRPIPGFAMRGPPATKGPPVAPPPAPAPPTTPTQVRVQEPTA